MLIFRGFTLAILQGTSLALCRTVTNLLRLVFCLEFQNYLDSIYSHCSLVSCFHYGMYFLKYTEEKNNWLWIFYNAGQYFCRKLIGIILAINFLTFKLASYKGIPIILLVIVILVVIYTFFSQRTIPGRHMYAYGGNKIAAKLSGVNTRQVIFWIYTNMGLLAALAGIVFTGRLNSATPKTGVNFELDAIAACFIGGASMSGGVGTVIGCNCRCPPYGRG